MTRSKWALNLVLCVVVSGNLAADSKEASQALLAAAAEGDVDAMRQALAKGADPNVEDENGNTPLMMVAVQLLFGDESSIVGELIAKKAKLDEQNGAGMTALMYAAREDHPETVKALLGAGAKHDLKDPDGWTALMQTHKAAMIGKSASERWLPGSQKEEEPMPQASIFQWRDGAGWLVLTGRAQFDDIDMNEVLAQALSRTVSLGPLAYIWAAGDENTAEQHLEILADMGSQTGYLVDIVTEDDAALTEQLEQAGVVIIGDGDNLERLRGAFEGTVLKSLESAFERGATIIGMGNGALVLAQWLYLPNGELRHGYGWLKNALME